MTDTEPAATPLGPFAVVDVLKGTAPALAATRQGCGFYDVVQELARVHEEKRPPAPPPAPDVPSFATPTPRAGVPAPVPAKPEQAPRSRGETVQARIAPRKRTTSSEAVPPDFEEGEEASSFLKRDLPKPRGRFTRLDAPKTSYQELTRASGKDVLEAAVGSHEHRFALLQSLAQQYNGSRGDLTLMELEGVLRAHGLMEAMENRERTALLSAFTEHRGASGRVGWALGLSPSELRQLEAKAGLSREVEEVRERFRREALTARNLTQKLDLLGREKYLVDLGIKKRFTDMLRRELEVLVRDELSGVKTLSELADVVARKHGAPSELVLRALERLGVAEGLRKRGSEHSPHSTP
ncbi:transcriptional regulator, Fis family [Archangium gephyra]|uniref:Transcriptional regulator, Fis family n=1 Tax=Archangium gephyra TaxID=48 RepID=A0AAC8TF40_9BACT|nr:transcriptional regulator, Fis family [Archangium gephyra]